jgi:hypothetical protein
MTSISRFLRLLLALPLALSSSCATFESGERDVRPATVRHTWLSAEHLQLDFEPLPPQLSPELMSEEQAHALLAAFFHSFPEDPQFQLIPASASSAGTPAPWERKLRAEFLKHYGASRLPLPHSLQHSPLFMALRMSPRYMGPGIRDAAQQMFRSPIFLASVALSVLVYFSAWVLPEPFFSKAFAATLTARLAFVVGLIELRNVALACLQLYRDAQAARTQSYSMAGGLSFQSASTAHVVADGTIVLAGAILGTAGSAMSSACTDGSQKKEGYQWHHLATDKNESSPLRGGPWTPLFEQLFAKAGMHLDDPANRVYLAGHLGPHPEQYHREIYGRLEEALRGCRAVSQCKSQLLEELRMLRSEVCTPGSPLHRLLTKP